MSDPIRCPVVRIDRVEQHPTVDRYNINYFTDVILGDLQTVSDKKEDGSSRYASGDLAAFFPDKAIIPLEYLKFIGYVDSDGVGLLSGTFKNVVKKGNFKSVKSMGILTSVDAQDIEDDEDGSFGDGWLDTPPHNDGVIADQTSVDVGQDVSDILGIVK